MAVKFICDVDIQGKILHQGEGYPCVLRSQVTVDTTMIGEHELVFETASNKLFFKHGNLVLVFQTQSI